MQEAVIFSIFGDSVSGLYNSSPAAAKILTGDKDHDPPSDIHSSIARNSGIPRGIAKNLFYGIEFGSGLKTCSNTIRSGDRSIPIDKADELGRKALSVLKGDMVTHDGKNYMYVGGEASKCFNVLMSRGDEQIQTFPVTGSEYPTSMQKRYTGKNFMLTRNNMQIQASGKHLMEVLIVLTQYWCKKFSIDQRYLIGVHDSSIFSVKEEDVYDFCAIVQMAHVFCYALLRQRLGIEEIGLSGAFLTGFEVGDFFMKSDSSGTATPFNPNSYRVDRYTIKLDEVLPNMVKLFR